MLISQDRMRGEHYTRQGEFWLFTALEKPEDTLTLASIGCRILLAEIYDKVSFDPEEKPHIGPTEPLAG